MILSDILHELKQTPSSYQNAARQIEAGLFEETKPVNVAILSTFTADMLRPYLIVESAVRGMLARPYFAPFNQLEQQVLEGNSRLYGFNPDVVVIATRIEEIAPNLVYRFVNLSSADVDSELVDIEKRVRSLIEAVRRFTKAAILVFNYASPVSLAAGLADTSLETSQTSVIQRANEGISELCQKFANVYVFDYWRLTNEIGLRRVHDPKLWFLGRVPFGAEAQLEIGRSLARYLKAICFPSCKCLVLDLDNTLWGGVLGEEGPDGIALGEDYPGNMYKEFQRKLLSLRDRGVLLAVASKNNESDVLAVLQNHPDCLLRVEDFAALQIHWQEKTTSLATIAKELNISTDALAFFDDSPFERERVRSQMPEVTVIDVPESPFHFPRVLDESGAFDSLTITAEDTIRAEVYHKERQRKQLKTQTISVEEFLRQLEMTATIGYVNRNTLNRVSQLIAKTNQFNLTTRRYTPSELQAMIEEGVVALWIRVEDRFGDNGLVGAAVAIPRESGHWSIDTFLLSCRVLERKVETVLLSVLSDIVRKRGGTVVLGEYVPTQKNNPASEFYRLHGFERVDGANQIWRCDLLRSEMRLPEFIKLRFADE